MRRVQHTQQKTTQNKLHYVLTVVCMWYCVNMCTGKKEAMIGGLRKESRYVKREEGVNCCEWRHCSSDEWQARDSRGASSPSLSMVGPVFRQWSKLNSALSVPMSQDRHIVQSPVSRVRVSKGQRNISWHFQARHLQPVWNVWLALSRIKIKSENWNICMV